MIRPATILVSVGLLALQATPASAAERNLDRWFERELLPYVTTQLVEHPRFKGETVMFVVLDDNAPASVSNELAISLRDRLLDAALNTAGVSIGRRQGGTPPGGGTRPVDCTHDDVHYYIGIELSPRIDGSHGVTIRALDLEDRNWVTGFGMSWQGQLSTVQRRAMRTSHTDPTFRGARDVPFSADETDLLAAHLAHELTCALFRDTGGNYVVAIDGSADESDSLQVTVELVGNNLARHDALELSEDESRVNARLSGKAHRIDGALFQYWLAVTPNDPSDELSTLSTSAYILMPGHRLAGESLPEPRLPPEPAPSGAKPRAPQRHADASISIPHAGRQGLLGPLRIIESPASCADGSAIRRTSWGESRQRCSLLATDARGDAIVFVLEHQANYGLVRLGGPNCRERTSPHLVTRGALMRYPIPFQSIGNSQTREAREWLLSPGVDTYYAFAITDARAARQFANHIDQLPLRCGVTVRRGLTNNALHRWLDEFAVLAARHARHVDWRAIEVKDVL